jgi:hypothetical protein
LEREDQKWQKSPLAHKKPFPPPSFNPTVFIFNPARVTIKRSNNRTLAEFMRNFYTILPFGVCAGGMVRAAPPSRAIKMIYMLIYNAHSDKCAVTNSAGISWHS